jgi:hypothetical protein
MSAHPGAIRTDDGYWQSVEQYVCTHTEATFTHGVCPDCSVKLEADLESPPPKPVARSVVRQTVPSRGA